MTLQTIPLNLRSWLIAAAVVSLVVFSWPRSPVSTAALVRPSDRWELPPLPVAGDLAEQAKSLGTSARWGGSAALASTSSAPKPPDNRWYIAGIYDRGGEQRAVIRFLARPEERVLKIGEKTPDGEKVTKIGSDAVWVKTGRRLAMYDLRPDATGTGTAAGAPAASAPPMQPGARGAPSAVPTTEAPVERPGHHKGPPGQRSAPR